jgi:hypothetical protein
MALQKSIAITVADQSITIPNAYIRISNINGSKQLVGMRVQFLSGPDGEVVREQSYTFTPDMNGDNFIKQAYLHLKSLEYFSDATDC